MAGGLKDCGRQAVLEQFPGTMLWKDSLERLSGRMPREGLSLRSAGAVEEIGVGARPRDEGPGIRARVGHCRERDQGKGGRCKEREDERRLDGQLDGWTAGWPDERTGGRMDRRDNGRG